MNAPQLPYKIKPWNHQLQAIRRAASETEFGLFFEMGTGKTSTTINILRHAYYFQQKILRTLIICPPIVIENWRREFLAHSQIKDTEIIPLVGPGHQRLALFLKHAWDPLEGKRGKIFITNFESMLMTELFDAIYTWTPEVLVVDESHRVKDLKAKRTKAIIQLADKADHRYILSGSPILNSPMDIFAQFRILDGGTAFGKNFFAFRNHYFYDKNGGMPADKHFPNWIVKAGALEEINKKIATKSMRILKSECLDLPPLVREEIFVELSNTQKRLYETMKADFITYINDKACVATLAITKALRLMQIVSGFVKVEDKDGDGIISLKDNPRSAALEQLLEEITPNAKCLVWAVFRENYATIRAICEKLQLGFVEVHGDISAKQKLDNVDRFNNDPSCRVLLGHPGSGGIGINLTAASYSIFYSRTFSLEQDLQAEARNHRGGSEVHKKITRYDLIAKNTIDELITKRLAGKVEISTSLLQELAKEL